MKRGGGVIAALRQLAPKGEMSEATAWDLAERQASLLWSLWGLERPMVPDRLLRSIDGVRVERIANWPASGMAVRVDDLGWRVVLRGSEPPERQRFTLAHELAHIVHDPFVEAWGLGHSALERLCDHFAACLLMPRPLIELDCSQERAVDLDRLAARYGVSAAAMRRRLRELRLMERQGQTAGSALALATASGGAR